MATIQEINCRIDELTPEQQIDIVRLINTIASHRNSELEIRKVMRKIVALRSWLSLRQWNDSQGPVGRHARENQDINEFLDNFRRGMSWDN